MTCLRMDRSLFDMYVRLLMRFCYCKKFLYLTILIYFMKLFYSLKGLLVYLSKGTKTHWCFGSSLSRQLLHTGNEIHSVTLRFPVDMLPHKQLHSGTGSSSSS